MGSLSKRIRNTHRARREADRFNDTMGVDVFEYRRDRATVLRMIRAERNARRAPRRSRIWSWPFKDGWADQ